MSRLLHTMFLGAALLGCKKSQPTKSDEAKTQQGSATATGSGSAGATMGSGATETPGMGPKLGDLNKVGATELKISCAPAVQADFDRGVAMLHSFFYEEARRVFTEVATKDPTCAMAQWGIAQTWWHPLWTAPNDKELTAGRDAAKKALELGGKTDLEKGFIAAMSAFYETESKPGGSAGGQSCHGPISGDHRTRAVAYAKAMETLFSANKDNVEVATFYALSLLGTAVPGDKTLQNPKAATEILEKFWTSHGSHPGVAHYLIHGYDFPPLAKKGLPAANAYSSIAPWVPHVQHMPSHIFVRLGMWPEVLKSNLASADAGRQYAAMRHADATGFDELHALDYLIYGYLQQGDDAEAAKVAERTAGVKKTYPEVDFVIAYAMGAIPARYALERRDYAAAASQTIMDSPNWAKFPFGRAGLEFAMGVGAAKTGKVDDAKKALAALEASATATSNPAHAYFANQVKMQAQTVQGLVQIAEGKKDDGIKTLQAAADADDTLGKHPVSPGSVIPARELLADALLEMNKPADALAQYEKVLELNPKRFNALHGAGKAAEMAGKADVAKKHYEALVAQVAPTATRKELEQVKAFLAKK